MVRLYKSPLLPGVSIKSEKDYRKGEVLKTLAKDLMQNLQQFKWWLADGPSE